MSKLKLDAALNAILLTSHMEIKTHRFNISLEMSDAIIFRLGADIIDNKYILGWMGYFRPSEWT